jgi:hypothetical protein
MVNDAQRQCSPRGRTPRVTSQGWLTTTAAPGEANTNGAIAELTDEGQSCLRTSGTANLVIDCSGWWI